jgi:hypothetical protein
VQLHRAAQVGLGAGELPAPRADQSPVVVQHRQRGQVAGLGEQRERLVERRDGRVHPPLHLPHRTTLQLDPGQERAGQHPGSAVELGKRGGHPPLVGQRQCQADPDLRGQRGSAGPLGDADRPGQVDHRARAVLLVPGRHAERALRLGGRQPARRGAEHLGGERPRPGRLRRGQPDRLACPGRQVGGAVRCAHPHSPGLYQRERLTLRA